MFSFSLGAVCMLAVCLLVNFYFPAVFAKLTRKAGKAAEKARAKL